MTTPKKNNSSLLEQIHYYDLNINTRTIYLHSQEYSSEDGWSENGVDYKMATKFIKNLDYFNSISEEPIKVIMTSCGGCWNFGMMIYDAIKQSKSPIDIYAYAHARSMTSIILQAARKRYISKHCDFMIHYGEYSDSGDLRKVTNGITYYEKHNKEMFNIYAERCCEGEFFKGRMRKEDVSDYLELNVKDKVDFWLSADEAVKFGFADEMF